MSLLFFVPSHMIVKIELAICHFYRIRQRFAKIEKIKQMSLVQSQKSNRKVWLTFCLCSWLIVLWSRAHRPSLSRSQWASQTFHRTRSDRLLACQSHRSQWSMNYHWLWGLPICRLSEVCSAPGKWPIVLSTTSLQICAHPIKSECACLKDCI